MWLIYSAVLQMPGSTGHGAAEFKRHNAENFAISFASFHVDGGGSDRRFF